ncbi:hypothetical protein [Hoeflea sp.]|uniref:hypothetical protein n=1 Tax=Hoeflea sp. TaxID=1940281 RepID=UPI00198FCF75|nr:hypothetical protein [Hoeflea sp.]MBC7282597.1 hypothetical protein [Hoeflea sp.]
MDEEEFERLMRGGSKVWRLERDLELARDKALEDAAQVAEMSEPVRYWSDPDYQRGRHDASKSISAAIRAMKKGPAND